MKKILFLFTITGLVIISCTKSTTTNSSNNPVLDCTNVSESFSTNVNPIIQTTCAVSGCHGAGSTNGPGPLLTYNQIFSARVAIRSAVSSGEMPLGGNLSTAQKNTILCWIDNGSVSN